MKGQEEEETMESERATQLAACRNRKLKQKLEKCDVHQNTQDNITSYTIIETETDQLKKLVIKVKDLLKAK